jgi:hypothetical protein
LPGGHAKLVFGPAPVYSHISEFNNAQ